MSLHDDVAREAYHDYLDNRPGIERPTPDEYEDGPDACGQCGRDLLPSEGPLCSDCEERR